MQLLIMVRVYAVSLEPLKIVEPISKGQKINDFKSYAVISEKSILVESKSPLALGYQYYEFYKKKKEESPQTADIICYDCPGKVLITSKGPFRTRNLGQLYIKDFEKGLLAEFHNLRIKSHTPG